MIDLTGKTIKGFEVQEKIGTGGAGNVYRAFQKIIDRKVAIKIISSKHANKPDFILRFESEAQTIAQLEHPFIVPLYDYWRDPQGAYLVMRWFRGGNLRTWLKNGAIPLKEAIKLLEQIASALHTAHKQKVVHRDIKPDNILLDMEKNAYLSDFGIAKLIGENTNNRSFTGTLAYIAPEQIVSRPPTPQADIYSFGIMMFEILTGQHPFPESTVTELLLAHANDPLPNIRTIQPNLPNTYNLIIQQATAKNPENRYQDIRELIQALHDSANDTSEITTTWSPKIAPLNPYKGLRAFQENDAVNFFGREALITELQNRLQQGEKFLAIVGPSGSGKSSVVRAGLIPIIRAETLADNSPLYIADLIPGNQAILALSDALISVSRVELPNLEEQIRANERGLITAIDAILQQDDGKVLLFIDQFEEIFTPAQDETEREQFLQALYIATTDPKSRLQVIITLRADFYDRPLLYEGFGTLVQQHTQVVLPLSTQEIEQAIVGPARRSGLKVDTQLIAAIVADIREEPGGLPLLQYALTELFEQSSKEGRLNHDTYEQNGRIEGVLAKRANELYEELSQDHQELARQIFLRLVQLGDGTEDTRRRVGKTTLQHLGANRETLDEVLNHFGKARLLTFDIDSSTREPMIEVAHEALIRRWDRLRIWLDESRDDLRLHYKLIAALNEWQTYQQHNDFLLTRGRLVQFEDWAKNTNIKLSPDEKNFLEISIEQQNTQIAAEEKRQQQELNLKQESIRRLRYLFAAVFVIAVLGIAAAIFSIAASQRATDAQAIAESNEIRAIAAEATAIRRGDEAQARVLANRLPSLALNNPSLAYSLGIALLEKMESVPISVRFAINDLFINTHIIRQYLGHSSPLTHVTFSQDGLTALSSSTAGEIFLWDIETGDIIRRYEGHEASVRSIFFSPDERSALSTSNDATMILWDVETGDIIRHYEGHASSVLYAIFSPDGERILSASYDNTVKLWDVETGDIIRTFEAHTSWVWEVAYAPDGKTGLSASNDGNIIWWDLETGEQLAIFEEHTESVPAIAFSPDGENALSGSYDGTMILRNLETGEILRTYQQDFTVWDVIFSPDGQFILSSSDDGSVFLWDIDDSKPRQQFKGHVRATSGISLSSDTQTAISAAEDGTLLLWDIERITRGPFFEGHTSLLDGVSISPDGQTIVSASWDGTLIRWDIATADIIQTYIGHVGNITGHAYAPNGETLISGDRDGTIIIWDVESGSPIFTRHIRDAYTNEIISASQSVPSDSITLESLQANTDLRINAAAYTPDSETALIASMDKTLILWDIHTGEAIRIFADHTGGINDISVSPDGQTALSASEDGTLILWNINTSEAIRTFSGHRAAVMGVDFAPDGLTAISSSADGRLLLWDIETGATIREFVGHSLLVDAVEFSPDGLTALSTSADGSLILWDIQTGEALRYLISHRAWASGVVYTPDGQYAVSASGDRTLILWALALPDEELIAWARENRVIAELTCEEYLEYGVPVTCED